MTTKVFRQKLHKLNCFIYPQHNTDTIKVMTIPRHHAMREIAEIDKHRIGMFDINLPISDKTVVLINHYAKTNLKER